VLPQGDAVRSALFSFDRSRLVTVAEDVARVWDVKKGTLLSTFKNDRGVENAVFNPKGTRVLSVSGQYDNTVYVWDATTGVPVARLPHSSQVYSASFSPDGNSVVTASLYNVCTWDAESGALLMPPIKSDGLVYKVVFSPEGDRILTAAFRLNENDFLAGSHLLRVWDSNSGLPLASPLEIGATVVSMQFDMSGDTIAILGSDAIVRSWSVRKDRSSLVEWRAVARCAPFSLVDGILKPQPAKLCASLEVE